MPRQKYFKKIHVDIRTNNCGNGPIPNTSVRMQSRVSSTLCSGIPNQAAGRIAISAVPADVVKVEKIEEIPMADSTRQLAERAFAVVATKKS